MNTPKEIVPHEPKYQPKAWEQYSLHAPGYGCIVPISKKEGNMTLYHVVGSQWAEGQPLKSLASMMPWGDDVAEMLISKWDIHTTDMAYDYYCTDGREVHCLPTLAAAVDFRTEYAPGCRILQIDASSLEVTTGREYPHPVVRDEIPAEFISIVDDGKVPA